MVGPALCLERNLKLNEQEPDPSFAKLSLKISNSNKVDHKFNRKPDENVVNPSGF